jgi:hypothetical protein
VDHRKLNEVVDAHRRQRKTPAPPFQIGNTQADRRPVTQQLRIVSVLPDYLQCLPFPDLVGPNEEEEPLGYSRVGGILRVAKPWLLRQTPFHEKSRGDIDYVYTDTDTRTATNEAGESVVEVIVSPYLVDDVIYAMWPILGGTYVSAIEQVSEMRLKRGPTKGAKAAPFGESSTPTSVDWLDLNVDGRMWAIED